MGKIVLIISFLTLSVFAEESASTNAGLESTCLSCHQEEQIPSSLIYKRYLLKYSTDARMKKAMLSYMKAPNKGNSIMPAPFFLKFPMKEKMDFDEVNLRKNIEAYLKKFNMKKRLILQKK